MDFKRLRERGKISPTDFHRLCGVSRVSCSLWFTGKKAPHQLHASRIGRIVDALLKAIDAGELPLTTKMKADARASRIKDIAKRFL